MKLVTFNIRYDCGTDGINNFSCRKPFILETIAREQPDVIGFQEVLPHVALWMKGLRQEKLLMPSVPQS